MRSSILISGIILLFITNCSGINSEGDTAYIPDKPNFQKPRCNFKASNNCWTKSVALLSNCLGPEAPNEVDVFKDGNKYCSNSSGKLIVFPRPFQLEDEGIIEFEAWNKKKCFDFKGDDQSFEIDGGLELGKLSVAKQANGDIQVQCFHNESFVIPAEAVENGCQGVSNKVGDYLPKASLFSFQEVEDFGYQFVFQGVGGSPQSIFKCYE